MAEEQVLIANIARLPFIKEKKKVTYCEPNLLSTVELKPVIPATREAGGWLEL
jgi:hypothetical protein